MDRTITAPGVFYPRGVSWTERPLTTAHRPGCVDGTNLLLWLPYGPRHSLQEITKSIAKRAQVHSDSAPFDLRATFRVHDTVRRSSKLVWGKRLLHFFHVADAGVGRFLRPATKRCDLAANAGSRTHSHDSEIAANAHEADHHDRDDRFLHLPRFTRRPGIRKTATRFAQPGHRGWARSPERIGTGCLG